MKNFNKTSLAEFRATLIIGAILILAVIIPGVYHSLFPAPPAEETSVQIHAFDLADDTHYTNKKGYNSPRKTASRRQSRSFSNERPIHDKFPNTASATQQLNSPRPVDIRCHPFDPNEVSAEDLIAMGVSAYVAGNLVKYRNSGARLKEVEDLQRIYGMDSMMYAALSPCIRIAPSAKNKDVAPSSIDINSAGPEEWKSLPGIGDVLAERIIKYRRYLGGFVSIDQIAETYGLPPETMQLIRERLVLQQEPEKMDVNSAQVEQLASHPYITQRQAEAIVNYRNTHGNFTETRDLLKIYSLDEMWYARIQPYLSCGNNPDAASGLVVR